MPVSKRVKRCAMENIHEGVITDAFGNGIDTHEVTLKFRVPVGLSKEALEELVSGVIFGSLEQHDACLAELINQVEDVNYV